MSRFSSRQLLGGLLLLLALLTLSVGGCGGNSEQGTPLSSRDVGNWRGSADGYIHTSDNYPQTQTQSADVALQVKPDQSFVANLKITVMRPGSSDVQSVHDGVLSGTPTIGSLFTGTLSIDGSTHSVDGFIGRPGGYSKKETLVLQYTYADGPTWNVTANLNRAP